ncbi:hypothetical protein I5677_07665 [Mobilitalea sibirica]|uniref:Uncharacterized protein n=1 Tax=Mobilitalea sibirica TaxID=1462919 RepID=A0A8J7KSY0_9FIRM|nr:hypothetical protein [Mobilitalea sibirica]MBH1940761.1 hypothetical protein [Mobilitalea sibirica]
MSYQEKRTIVSIITGLFILVAYGIYAFEKYQSGVIAADDIKAWAGIMLVFIGIGVVLAIVIQIVFHILLSITIAIQERARTGRCGDDKEIEKTISAKMVTDEMDKLIELKSMRVSFIIAGIGFVTALVTQLFNYPPAVLLNVLFISFSAGSLLEGLAQIYFYRRGIKNG